MELSFAAHLQKPYHFKKPNLPYSSNTFEVDGVNIELFCLFSNSGEVQKCYFYFEKDPSSFYFTSYYSYFCQWIEGKKYTEVESFTYPDSWNLCFLSPVLLQFRALYRSFIGLSEDSMELFSNTKETLVCRCFGVSEESIFLLKKRNSNTNLQDVMGALYAGAGCGSCTKDIEEILAKNPGVGPNTMLYNGKTSSEMLVEIDNVLKDFFYTHHLEPWEIASLERGILLVSSENWNLVIKEELEAYLLSRLDFCFKILSLGSTT